MIKTFGMIFVVFFSVLGVISFIYGLILSYAKNRSGNKTFLIVRLSGDYLKDVRIVMYALERKTLYCDSPDCDIIALDTAENGENGEKIRDLFSVCPSVNVVKTDNLINFIKNSL